MSAKRNRVAIAVTIVALAAIGLAVWWFYLRGPTPAEAAAETGYVLPDANVVGGVNVGALLETSIGAQLVDGDGYPNPERFPMWVHDVAKSLDVKAKDLRSVAFSVRVAMPGAEQSGAPPFVAAVESNVQRAGVLEAAKKHGLTATELSGVPVLKTAAADVAFPEGGPIVVGSSSGLHAVLAGSGKVDEGLLALRRRLLDEATIWAAFLIPEGGLPLPDLPLPGVSALKNLRRVGLSLDLRKGLVARGAGELRTAAEAKELADGLGTLKSAMQLKFGFDSGRRAAIIKRLLNAVTITSDGPVLAVDATLDEGDLQKLVNALGL